MALAARIASSQGVAFHTSTNAASAERGARRPSLFFQRKYEFNALSVALPCPFSLIVLVPLVRPTYTWISTLPPQKRIPTYALLIIALLATVWWLFDPQKQPRLY